MASTCGPPVSKKPTQVSFGFAQRNLKPFRSKPCGTAWKMQRRGVDWGPDVESAKGGVDPTPCGIGRFMLLCSICAILFIEGPQGMASPPPLHPSKPRNHTYAVSQARTPNLCSNPSQENTPKHNSKPRKHTYASSQARTPHPCITPSQETSPMHQSKPGHHT